MPAPDRKKTLREKSKQTTGAPYAADGHYLTPLRKKTNHGGGTTRTQLQEREPKGSLPNHKSAGRRLKTYSGGREQQNHPSSREKKITQRKVEGKKAADARQRLFCGSKKADIPLEINWESPPHVKGERKGRKGPTAGVRYDTARGSRVLFLSQTLMGSQPRVRRTRRIWKENTKRPDLVLRV